MTEFTYKAPNEDDFLYTLQSYFDAKGDSQIALLLADAKCKIDTSTDYSHIRWDACSATFTLFVPMSKIPEFTEKILQEIWYVAKSTMPPEAGYDFTDCRLAPKMESRPVDNTQPANVAQPIQGSLIEHDGLRFRSRAEIHIYDELKKRPILFFANATATLGSKNDKREPDFLICQNGNWGILEVMGSEHHPNATHDHARARIFKDFGVMQIEFYDAKECYQEPKRVVDDFLKRLGKL